MTFAQTPRARTWALALAALVLCLLPLRATAHLLDPLLQAWRWAHFTTESGLPVDRVAIVSEAADGTVWADAQNRLALFDSYTWHPAPHPWVDVTSLVAQPGGRAVVVDGGRLFEGGLQGFTPVTASGLGPLRAAAPLGDGRVALLDEDGRLFAMRGRTIEPLATPDGEPARALLAAGQNAWVSAPGGVYRWTARGWQQVLAATADPLDVTAAAENAAGQGVFCVLEPVALRGLWSFEPGEGARPHFDLPRALIGGLAVAPNGEAVAAFTTGELLVRRGGRWAQQAQPIAELTNVLSLAFRPGGDLWVATETGLNLFRGSSVRWRVWNPSGSLSDSAVNEIARGGDGTLWLGSSRGVLALGTDGVLRSFPTDGDLHAFGAVTGVGEDARGRIWIGSGGGFAGAYYRDGDRWRHFSSGTALDHAYVHRIAKDRRGRLWFLCLSTVPRYPTPPDTSPGVFVLDGDTVTPWSERDGLPPGRVYAFAEGPDGAYWFGTEQGVSRWLGGRWTRWTNAEGLRQARVFALLVDDEGRVWFGDQQNGLGLIEHDAVRYLTTADGLVSDAVWGLAQGADGALWIATRGGLSRRHDGAFSSFDLAAGLENTALWPVLAERDAVYVGMASGLARLNLAGARAHLPVVRPLETIVHAGTALVRWRAFEFDGRTPPDRIPTRVRLDDGPWSAWSTAREATFTGLSSGPHRVAIQAENLFGLHEAAGVVADLRVDPPLVQQPVFYGPVGALLLVVLLLAIALIVRQRRHQRALAEREQRFALVSRVTNDAVWDWEVDGDHCAWGEGLQASFGYSSAEAVDQRGWWAERVHPDDRDAVRAGLEAALAGDAQVWTADYRFRRQDGRYAAVFDRGYIMRDADGRARRLIGAMMDATERRELQEQIRHAQKLESIGRLAGGIAHEFNNLLTVIIGNIELLLAESGPADPRRAELEDVRAAAKRAARLTSQMLGFARRQIIRPTLLDLNHLILDVETMLRGGIGEEVQLVSNAGPGLGLVRMDPSQVEQVLVNLALNARDAMPGGGRLTIETRNAEVAQPPATAAAGAGPGRYVVLSVADTGVGMDEGTMAHLFEPFFTTKPPGQGSGLGLATCYGIVRQNGGYIQVQSRPGQGTRFDVYLPRAEEAGEPAGEVPAGPADRTGSGQVLLVVEDESGLRRLMVRTLRASGYDVIEAASGPDALRAVAKLGTPPGLLVTDIVMPHMSGVELAAELRARWPALQVLFTSGYAERARSSPLDAPGERFLPKPFTPAALRHEVEKLLAARTS